MKSTSLENEFYRRVESYSAPCGWKRVIAYGADWVRYGSTFPFEKSTRVMDNTHTLLRLRYEGVTYYRLYPLFHCGDREAVEFYNDITSEICISCWFEAFKNDATLY